MLPAMSDPIADLIAFIDRSPTPYHAVAEAGVRLRAAGYQPVGEDELWALAPGDRRYLERNEGSLVAFEVGSQPPSEGGFRIVGAHTDSPNLRLKPVPEKVAKGVEWETAVSAAAVKQRAENMLLYLSGDAAAWAAHCADHCEVDDIQNILAWVALAK